MTRWFLTRAAIKISGDPLMKRFGSRRDRLRAISALPFILSAIVLFSQGCASSRERGTYSVRAQIRKVVELPMVSVDGVPFVQAHVNGAGPFWFILDTGAEADVVHSRLAHELRLQKVNVLWFNKALGGDWCDGIDLVIGGARYRPDRVASTVLDDIEKVFQKQIDGILGQHFFHCFVVELDYPRQVLRLHPSRRFNRDATAIPIAFHGFHPVVEANIELTSCPPASGSFFVDTGSVFELELGSNFFEAREIEEPAESIPSQIMMLHGRSDARSTYGVRLKVGRISVEKPRVMFGASSGLDYEGSIDGTIGGGFLRRFHVIFDYPHKKLWLEESHR